MKYTVMIFNTYAGGIFDETVEAANATQAFHLACLQHYPDCDIPTAGCELVACIRGEVEFENPNGSVLLFPGAV